MVFKCHRTLPILFVAAALLSAAGCGKSPNGEGNSSADNGTSGPAVPPVAAVRGTFGAGACEAGQRVTVPDNAAFAAYFDSDGNEIVSAPVEVLAGTEGNLMCPATDEGPEPGFCTPLCTKKIGGRNVCVTC